MRNLRPYCWNILLLLSLPLTAHAEVDSKNSGEWVVRQGDTCLRIAREAGLSLDELHRLNPNLGPGPNHNLKAGSRLLLRSGPDARLTFIRPQVETREPAAAAWQPGKQNQDLYQQYRVATRSNAGAEVTFASPSNSLIRLTENSLIVIYGTAEQSSRVQRTGVELVEGNLKGSLAAMRAGGTPAQPLNLKTAGATVQATSPAFLLDVDEKKTSRLAVYDGKATMTAQGVTVKVPKNNGTLTEVGKAPEPPTPLLPPPGWVTPLRSTRMTADAAISGLDFSWTAVAGSTGYMLEVATDKDFRDVALRRRVDGKTTKLELNGLSPNLYYVHASTIDRRGIQGRPGAALQVAVVRLYTTDATLENGIYRGFRVAHFQTDDPLQNGTLEVTLDGKPQKESRFEVRELGTHRIAVRPKVDGFDAAEVSVEIYDYSFTLSVLPQQLSAGGGQVLVIVGTTQPLKPGQSIPDGYLQLDGKRYPLGTQADGTRGALLPYNPLDKQSSGVVHYFVGDETESRIAVQLSFGKQ